MNTGFSSLGLIVVGLLGFVPGARAIDFDKEIKPILRSRCFKCHSGPRAENGLRYDDKNTLEELIDGEDGIIISGKAIESLLIKKVMMPRGNRDAMPPPGKGDPMTQDEIRLVGQWINEGAPLEPGQVREMAKPAAADADAGKVYSWFNTEGKEVKAGFVRLDGANVVLLLENGAEYPYAIAKLSAESQALAKKLGTGE